MAAPTITELVFVRYTVSFRPGMVFAETLVRMSDNYLQQVCDAYCAHNRCSLPVSDFKILTIANGWK